MATAAATGWEIRERYTVLKRKQVNAISLYKIELE